MYVSRSMLNSTEKSSLRVMTKMVKTILQTSIKPLGGGEHQRTNKESVQHLVCGNKLC